MSPDASDFTPKDLSAARCAGEAFLQALMRGDEPGARALLVPPKEGESMDFNSMHESAESFELGEARVDAGQVVALATIHPKPGQTAPPALPLVLVHIDGAWKADMGASVNRLLGGNFQDLVQEMAKGLGTAMATGMEAIAQGLSALSSPDVPPAEPAAPPKKSRAKPHPAKKKGKKRGK